MDCACVHGIAYEARAGAGTRTRAAWTVIFSLDSLVDVLRDGRL